MASTVSSVKLQHLIEVVRNNPHCLFELLPERQFGVVVTGHFIIDVPVVQEVAVLDVGTVMLLQEVGAVLGGAVRDLEGPLRQAIFVHGLIYIPLTTMERDADSSVSNVT